MKIDTRRCVDGVRRDFWQ